MPRQKRKLGTYKHYKGRLYTLLGYATHTETGEEFAVYQALYGRRRLWIRPRVMFEQRVIVNGKRIPRFEYVEG